MSSAAARRGETQALQPVRHGIQEIGQHQPGDEGQKNGAEQPQREDQHREIDGPDQDLPLQCHGVLSSFGCSAMWRSQAMR